MSEHAGARTIVVGVDGSSASQAALVWAVREARLRGAPVAAIHVCSRPWSAGAAGPYGSLVVAEMRETLEEAAVKLLEREVRTALARAANGREVEIEQRIAHGAVAQTLVSEARSALLLVVGSRGHGGFAGLLLGSVAQQCAHHSHCPVVIVR